MDDFSLWLLIPAALGVVNVVTFALFWIDKRRAQAGAWRIRERTLLTWCALGGWPAGLLAMRKLRHKTRDGTFLARYWACVGLWAAGIASALWVGGDGSSG